MSLVQMSTIISIGWGFEKAVTKPKFFHLYTLPAQGPHFFSNHWLMKPFLGQDILMDINFPALRGHTLNLLETGVTFSGTADSVRIIWGQESPCVQMTWLKGKHSLRLLLLAIHLWQLSQRFGSCDRKDWVKTTVGREGELRLSPFSAAWPLATFWVWGLDFSFKYADLPQFWRKSFQHKRLTKWDGR